MIIEYLNALDKRRFIYFVYIIKQ